MPDRRQIIAALLGVTLPGAGAAAQELGKIPLSAADAVAAGLPRFLSAAEFKAFAELARTLIPAHDDRPGAIEAGAPEFLDFLLGQSPAAVQQLYRQGLAQYARTKDLSPLAKPWTYDEPTDAYHRFLRAARTALYQATVNSKPWADTSTTRGSSPTGLYWLPID